MAPVMKIIVAEILCVLLTEVQNGVNSENGKSYVLGFMQNIRRRKATSGTNSVYITSKYKNTRAVIEIPFLNTTLTADLLANATSAINLPSATRMNYNVLRRRGIRITSNKDISVYGVNWSNKSSDGFLGIPVASLGTNYSVMSYLASSDKQSQFMIVATTEDTHVTIQTKNKIYFNSKMIKGGRKLRLIMNNLDSAQFGSQADLSGTRITSNKPIAVFSGVNCGQVPSGHGFCDHLVEQLPPIDQWGCEFLTSPLTQRTRGILVRILSAYDNTRVRIDWAQGRAEIFLHADHYRDESLPPSTSCKITCNKPCFVVQYSKGDPDQTSHRSPDPFMMIVPPVSQYQSHYDVAVPQPQHASYSTYVSIIIQSKETSGFMIDSKPSFISWTPLANTNYSWGLLSTKKDYHSLHHASSFFYAAVFGFSRFEAYGFPAGWAGLRNICGANPRELNKKSSDDGGRDTLDDKSEVWIRVILHMTAKEWNSLTFQLSVSKAFNEECHNQQHANSICKRILSYTRHKKQITSDVEPGNIIIRARPKQFSNLLLEVEMRVQFNSSESKTQILPAGDLIGLLQETASVIANYLGGVDILFINGKPLPEIKEVQNIKPSKKDVSMTKFIGIAIATLGLITGLVVVTLFLKRVKEKRSRPRSPYERVSVRYGPPYSTNTPPMGILSSQDPTGLQSDRSRIRVPQEALYAEGHVALDYASLQKGAMMPNGYAKLDPKTMDGGGETKVMRSTLSDRVYTIPTLQLPADSSHSNLAPNKKADGKSSLQQPSSEGAATNTGFLLDLKFHTYTNIPTSSFLQTGPRPLSASLSEKSADNMYLEVIDDQSSLAGLP